MLLTILLLPAYFIASTLCGPLDGAVLKGLQNSVLVKRGGNSNSRQLPQALIVGAKKCGTRALLEFLRLHPDIRATGPEVHFFDRHYNMGLDWYRNQMPTSLPGQITMEKTPSYFITRNAPERIHKMSKTTKLIIVVRDPVTRAISDYAQAASKRKDIPSFEEMAFMSNGVVNTAWGAIRIGMYARYIENWQKYFPDQQLHFVNGEELITDPGRVLQGVQTFLGLSEVIHKGHFYYNEQKKFPCLKKGLRSGRPKCLNKSKGRAHPLVHERTVQRLRNFYRPFNAKLKEITGIDFGY